jgi:hypothetical protein
MENIKIQFKGITRNTDDGICPDGECMELINARVKSSGIEPIGNPILLKQTENKYVSIYHHTIAKRYIGVTESGQMYEMPEDLSTENILATDVKAKSIDFIGNTVSIVTDEGIRYMIYKGNKYNYLGGLPELPQIKIKKEFTCKGFKSDSPLVHGRGLTDDETETFYQSQYAYFLKCVSELNKNSFYVHATEVRIAFRLFDGSYTKHSPIRLIYFSTEESFESSMPNSQRVYNITFRGRNNEMIYAGEQEIAGGGVPQSRIEEYVYFAVAGFCLGFEIESVDLSLWSDIISSIDVFSTPSMIYWNNIDLRADDEQRSAKELMTESSLFYKIGQFSLNGVYKSTQEDVSSDSLATCEALDDDTGTHNVIIPSRMYSYNGKLHVFDYLQKLFDGYDKDYIYDCDNGEVGDSGEIGIHVYINSSDGIKRVTKYHFSAKIPKIFPSYIMYPDYRAYKISIVMKYNGKIKSRTYDLTPHGLLNLAYHIYDVYDGPVSGEDTIEDASIDKTENWSDFNIITTYDNEPEEIKNIVKVSNVNNPFFFPAEQTYQFNTPIVGIQSNVIAMSQGQFGQFPLYVFTMDGVYAMSVGSGTVAYSTQTPVTRDVCNNPDSICGLDTMVAFSTDRGLMVIDGASTQLISEKIYGFLPSCTISSPVIMNILNVASLGDMASSSVFPDYLEGAKVGYNYDEKEIVVANSNFPYSYVYSLSTGEWHKISQQIENFVNSYPYTWAMTGNQILDLNNTHRSVSKIAVVTRPIKMGTLSHKRILQTALRGIARMSSSDLYIRGESVLRGESEDMFSDVGMYILASNDAEHFVLVGKKEMMKDIRDLVTRMNKTKPYKYFMVCLVGGVRTDVWIDYIEFVYSESFNNRLR